jgi:hypothetical protein
MDTSIFTDKKKRPEETDLKDALGKTYLIWQMIREFTTQNYKRATEEWNFPGEKYGWSFRIRDKKRVIVYLLPREGYFKVAMVFGPKATDSVIGSGISGEIKEELKNARPYAEGRGIRISVKDTSSLKDLYELIKIKLSGQL